MPILRTGMTVAKLADILTKMTLEGKGNLYVMQDLTGGKISPIHRGDIGVASDGSRVLVLRRGEISETKTNGVIHV